MPIQVSCQCGQAFQAKDELAGQVVHCPKCKSALLIPSPAGLGGGGLADLLSEEGLGGPSGPTCPECGSEIKGNAVLCVNCGFNMHTGKKLVTMSESGHAVGASDADKMMAKAAAELANQPIKHDKGYGSAGEAWVMFGIMMVGSVIGIGCLYVAFKWIDKQGNAPQVMTALGYIMFAVGYLWILMISYKDTFTQFLCCLLIPGYILLYMIVCLSECTMPAILLGVGLLMVGIAAAMGAFGGGDSSYLLPQMMHSMLC